MKNLEKQYPQKKKSAPEIPDRFDVSQTATNHAGNFHVEIEQPIEGGSMETSLATQNNLSTAIQNFAPANASQQLTIPTDIVAEYTQKVLKQLKKTVEDTLYLGLVIREAYHRMTTIEFDQFRKATGLDKNLSTACKYIGIGNVADELLPYASILPDKWTSVYLLTLLDRVTRKKLLDDGKITPDITGSSIRKLIAENSPPKVPGKSRSAKKYTYICGLKFDAPLDDFQRDLDLMVSDFIAKNNCVTKISSPLDGDK